MLDIKFVRENPELVKENIKKKFQDAKLPLVDEVLQLDAELRAAKSEAEALRASRNKLSKNIGALMAQGKKEEAEAVKRQVTENADRLKELEAQEAELSERLRKDMITSSILPFPSVKTTAKTWRCSALASRLCRISRCRITPISWSALTALTLTPRAAWRATGFTT